MIAGGKEPPERNEKIQDRKEPKQEKRKFDLVVDIQEKMAQGKNGGYACWAKEYNVKQFAESILFLQQHDIHDKETLDVLVDGSAARYSFPKSFVSYRKPRAVSMEQREQARKKLD